MKTKKSNPNLFLSYKNLEKDQKILVVVISVIFIATMIYRFGSVIGKAFYNITN